MSEKILLRTNHGEITLQLDTEKAPKSAENFKVYVEAGFYDGTLFHRVIDNFMIQGGGFTSGLQQKKTRDPIENEADNGLKNVKGSIAMARTSYPHSASSQFFINVNDNDFLDHRDKTDLGWGYAVFGQVIAGMEVVDAIRACATGSMAGHADVPLEEVVIESAEVIA